jgi:hypothetical protein
MSSKSLERFWRAQITEGLRVSAESDLVTVEPVRDRAILVRLKARGLVRRGGGVVEHEGAVVGVHFLDTHLSLAKPFETLSWLHPLGVWHPNIFMNYVCPGHWYPAMTLTDMIFQVHHLWSWQNFNTKDPLNPLVLPWIAENKDRIPVDTRPLKWRHSAPVRAEEREHA